MINREPKYNGFCVYVFKDEYGIPYYVGQTKYFKSRKAKHLARAKTSELSHYIKLRRLLKSGFPLEMEKLADNLDKDKADQLENYLRKIFNLGYLLKKQLTAKSIKHGKCYTKIYTAWVNLRDRCGNPKNKHFKDYGARGISYCKRWNSFKNFYLDMGDPPTEKHSLDRIDNNKGYRKKNCRWALMSTQARNTRRTKMLTYKNKTQSLIEWSEQLGMSYTGLRKRLHDGWTIKETFEIPLKSHLHLVTYKGKTQTIFAWAKELKISKKTLYERILDYGWDAEKSFQKRNYRWDK